MWRLRSLHEMIFGGGEIITRDDWPIQKTSGSCNDCHCYMRWLRYYRFLTNIDLYKWWLVWSQKTFANRLMWWFIDHILSDASILICDGSQSSHEKKRYAIGDDLKSIYVMFTISSSDDWHVTYMWRLPLSIYVMISNRHMKSIQSSHEPFIIITWMIQEPVHGMNDNHHMNRLLSCHMSIRNHYKYLLAFGSCVDSDSSMCLFWIITWTVFLVSERVKAINTWNEW